MGIKEKVDEVAVIVDQDGKVVAEFRGFGAVEDARAFLNQTAKIDRLRGAVIETGEKARKMLEKK